MNPTARAKIQWIHQLEGGRAGPFHGRRYSTVVRFDADAKGRPDEMWSLVVEFDRETDSVQEPAASATVWFLVEAAPHHALEVGNRFGLFEGKRMVARGEIVR